MEIIYERCCGLDVHKKMLVACLICPDTQGHRHKEIRTFRTMTQNLLDLHDWLQAAGCTHVALESTGVYWKPVYNLLEGEFEILVVNAQHIKAVPGRKTDVRDAEWIPDLLQHGLLTGSYIPPASQRELRELTRYRTKIVEERARAINRLQKTLEDTNLKLGDVVSDSMGKSARAMLEAMLAGQSDPVLLAELARGKLRLKRASLEQALVGTLQPHHRFLITEHLTHIDLLDEAVARVSQEIVQRMSNEEMPKPDPIPLEEAVSPVNKPNEGEPVLTKKEDILTWKEAIALLDSIPGINQRAAEDILTEIGLDMSRFPSAKHLASWAGVAPGNHESAGKRLSGATRKGSPWLRKRLAEVAHSAAHTKHTYLSAQYHRLASRRGAKKAMMAVAHSILVIIYHLLSNRESYQDLGESYFDERDRQVTEKRLVRRLEKLGYHVSLETSPAA